MAQEVQRVDPNSSSLYGGVTGATLQVNNFCFGKGVTIASTYAHLMAPYIMAFERAQPSQPNPAPWKTVEGGMSFDIEAELYVPLDFSPTDWFSRVGTMWWLTTLLKLRATPRLFTPVVSNTPFSKSSQFDANSRVWPVEVYTHRLLIEPAAQDIVSLDALNWVRDYWFNGGLLMNQNPELSMLGMALERCAYAGSPSLAMLLLWGALENLFGPGRDELRFRISTLIACYLEPPGETRLRLQEEVAGLYDSRSAVTHGRKLITYGWTIDGDDPLVPTYKLARRVFLKILEENHVPANQELLARLFGVNEQ